MSTSTLEALRALQTAPPVVASRRPTRAMSIGLAIVGLAAAAAIAFSFTRDSRAAALERQAVAEVDALVGNSARLGATLRTFGATREPESAWFDRSSALVAELGGQARATDATLVGIAMLPRAQVAQAVQAASEAVERARANASADRSLMARDVIESNGIPAVETLDRALAALRTATADEIGGTREAWRLTASGIGAGWAIVWAIGLVWLARASDALPVVARAVAARPASDLPSTSVAVAVTPEPVTVEAPEPAVAQTMRDSGTVADACEAVAGMTDASQMASALEGVAQALGASGLVLWMRDGDAMTAAASHGYPAGVPQRLGRVAVDDANLIARAWQARASVTAPEGPGQRAAVAAPIASAGVVTGVLSAELPEGREPDADVVATSRILAAQLSVVLGEGAATTTAPHFEATGS